LLNAALGIPDDEELYEEANREGIIDVDLELPLKKK
jgi:hypothetical protein